MSVSIFSVLEEIDNLSKDLIFIVINKDYIIIHDNKEEIINLKDELIKRDYGILYENEYLSILKK